MKGFLKWFKNESKMKRWIFLIILGILLACYGMMKLLTGRELEFIDLAKIVISFVIGFSAVIIGIVFIQKRTLEILVQESDTRQEAKDGNVKSLIFNKKVYDEGPNIVVIGGGTGLDSVLRGLKKYTNNITAIVTVSDYGMQMSDSRKALDTLPLDDIKDSLVALSSNESVMNGILDYKFTSGKLKSLSFGDIYLLAMKELFGDFSTAIEQTKNVLNITGRVLPVTLEAIDICAELDDGTIIKNKDKIPDIVSSKVSKINRIFISPSNCSPAPGVLEAIQNADAIIIGPGSLYTNVIPNLLVKGVAKAIKENKGFKIYISNIMTDPGQTDNYTLSDHIKAIHEHVGKGIVDYCIYDTGEIIPEFVRRYNEEGADLVEQDISKSKEEGVRMMQRNLSYIDGEFIRHNPDAIALAIIELVCEDLKFRDMQNDAQYLMLSTKVKKNRIKLRENTRSHKNKKVSNDLKLEDKRKSKFVEKYKDRIASIKESDEKALRKIEEKAKEKIQKNKKNNLINNVLNSNTNEDEEYEFDKRMKESIREETERLKAEKSKIERSRVEKIKLERQKLEEQKTGKTKTERNNLKTKREKIDFDFNKLLGLDEELKKIEKEEQIKPITKEIEIPVKIGQEDSKTNTKDIVKQTNNRKTTKLSNSDKNVSNISNKTTKTTSSKTDIESKEEEKLREIKEIMDKMRR